MPYKKALTVRDAFPVSWVQQVAAASLLTTYQLFANPVGGKEVYEFLGFDYSYDVVSSSGTVDLRNVATAIASTAGSSVLSATSSLSATARTPYKGSITTTAAARFIMPGSALSMIFGGTLTGLVGLNVIVWLKSQRGIRAR